MQTDNIDLHSQAGNASVQAASQAAPTFGMQQVMELYRNTLKLASENKITKDNTWGLGLIDHMSDLVKPSDEEQGQTNFQRASCTLDAGVKIYSYRVDSVHNSIYKTLGGQQLQASKTMQARTLVVLQLPCGSLATVAHVQHASRLQSCKIVT